MMTAVETPAGGAADLLMECEEEEQEVWPSSPERSKEEDEEGWDEGVQSAVTQMEVDQDSAPPPVRIIPIPVPPVRSSSPPTVKAADDGLGFMVNGRRVPLLPGGGVAELKLLSHPGGSASGFTTVQIPVTLTLHSPAGTHHINTTASLTASLTSPTPPAGPAPGPDPTPIITGVVSGTAAKKVLSDHNLNFKPSRPVKAPKRPASQKTMPPAPARTKRQAAAPPKSRRKGDPICPPDCPVCSSQYKLITELRGFICLCSPLVAQGLKNLKKRRSKPRQRSRDQTRTSRPGRGSRTRPGLSPSKVLSPRRTLRASDDFLSEHIGSPAPPSTASNPLKKERCEPLPDPPHGKLVILVEDFYYGSAPGLCPVKPEPVRRTTSRPYRCIHCPTTLRNNITLMSHMQEHVSTICQRDGGVDAPPSCPHCYRHFSSPLRLQRHLEVVHSQEEPTVTCRICELAFGSEPAFLWHMKNTHRPGEMPYACQVCDFRSSFHSDVWTHFQDAHADTRYLLCTYCLRVLKSSTCYQQHFSRHQRKHVLGCDKCRLHFLYVKERVEHKLLHHKTHVRPPQLSGLRPGTKVTVRTYSVVRGSEGDEVKRSVAACKVVDVAPPPSSQEAPKKKAVERLGPLLHHMTPDRVPRPSQRCIECLNSVPVFWVHFPSLVHCSLCRFLTCCATSYANHMINNHSAPRKNSKYQTMFQSDPRLSHTLRCVSCEFSTYRGDLMANHLTEWPEHTCITSTHKERRTNGAKKRHAGRQTFGRVGGAFVPIHLLSSNQSSTQLSIKPLTSPSPLSSPPAMTIKFLGPHPQPGQAPPCLLTVSQLSVVLSSVCHGVSQASRRHQTSPRAIRSWVDQLQAELPARTWIWRTDAMTQWLLGRREQQLLVGEDVLLLAARTALGRDSPLLDHYRWAVDFMLRHQLSATRRLLVSMADTNRSVIQDLCSQVQTQTLPPSCLGCMDELPVFIDMDLFSNQNPAAFQLSGSPEDRPALDVVLSALSDGRLLPPLLFFRGTAASLPEGFPDNVLLEARGDGFTEQERLDIWVHKVWRPHVDQLHGESLLMVDVHQGHQAYGFRNSLSSVSTDVLFIPSGCCWRLQPLDVCVTPVLRDFLQVRWTQLVCDGGLDGLDVDQLVLTLACWLSEVSSTLNSETSVLRRSFSLVCDLEPPEDGDEAATMISALTQALIQPLEGPG
ncbi:pogo transposable element with ZNF domain isoform X2 [Embiotoca jacksoni]|uniref:pogo transposable element with ZNF domain isoform X2 n=1 Tax=Embiotoca jacksoni TaxID=100190 RepID=UPI003703765A